MMFRDGYKFFVSTNGVWLTDYVLLRYIDTNRMIFRINVDGVSAEEVIQRMKDMKNITKMDADLYLPKRETT